jgi:hypothetical protein
MKGRKFGKKLRKNYWRIKSPNRWTVKDPVPSYDSPIAYKSRYIEPCRNPRRQGFIGSFDEPFGFV